MRFIINALMRILNEEAKENLKFDETGKMKLTVNKLYGIFGYIGIIVGIGFVIAMILSGTAPVGVIIGFGVGFGGLGLLLVLYYSNTEVSVTENQIEYIGLTKKCKVVRWQDIETVQYNRNSLEIILITKYDKIKLHMHLIGINSMIEVTKKKLDRKIYAEALGE